MLKGLRRAGMTVPMFQILAEHRMVLSFFHKFLLSSPSESNKLEQIINCSVAVKQCLKYDC